MDGDADIFYDATITRLDLAAGVCDVWFDDGIEQKVQLSHAPSFNAPRCITPFVHLGHNLARRICRWNCAKLELRPGRHPEQGPR